MRESREFMASSLNKHRFQKVFHAERFCFAFCVEDLLKYDVSSTMVGINSRAFLTVEEGTDNPQNQKYMYCMFGIPNVSSTMAGDSGMKSCEFMALSLNQHQLSEDLPRKMQINNALRGRPET